MTADHVIINSTAESDDFEVTNAYVESVSDDELIIGVFSFRSSDLVGLDDGVFVTVFRGN